jgi:hypothetical protein
VDREQGVIIAIDVDRRSYALSRHPLALACIFAERVAARRNGGTVGFLSGAPEETMPRRRCGVGREIPLPQTVEWARRMEKEPGLPMLQPSSPPLTTSRGSTDWRPARPLPALVEHVLVADRCELGHDPTDVDALAQALRRLHGVVVVELLAPRTQSSLAQDLESDRC